MHLCTHVYLHLLFFLIRSQPNRFKFSLNSLSKATKAIKNQEESLLQKQVISFCNSILNFKTFSRKADRYSSLRSISYQPNSLKYLNKYFMKSHHKVTSLLSKFPILFISKIVVDGRFLFLFLFLCSHSLTSTQIQPSGLQGVRGS